MLLCRSLLQCFAVLFACRCLRVCVPLSWGSCALLTTAPFLQTTAQFKILQHTATVCSTLQHNACCKLQHAATPYNTLQHTATHCNTLQHTATHCNTMYFNATQCNILPHNTIQCNTNQYSNTLQHPASRSRQCCFYAGGGLGR